MLTLPTLRLFKGSECAKSMRVVTRSVEIPYTYNGIDTLPAA